MNLNHYMFSSGDYIQCLYYSNATYTLLQSILRAAGSTFLSSLSSFAVFYFASLSAVLFTELLKRLLFVYSLRLSFNVLRDFLDFYCLLSALKDTLKCGACI